MVVSIWRTAGVIRPGRPIDNGYIESFNGRPRDERLNVETFFDVNDVREKLER
ncbi:transposase [bacterium]|nr:transposase [bacterium]